MFSAAEVRYLSESNRDRRWSSVPGDCPAEFLQKILQRRAAMLGPAFLEFRAQQVRPASGLEAELAASKPF